MASVVQQHEKTWQGEALRTLQGCRPEGVVVVESCYCFVWSVGKNLSHDLHELGLGFHHLLHLFLRSAARRHLLGLK
jgi:hypothetical protein